MESFKLDKIQRRILANQYRLLSHLDEAQASGHQRRAEILEEGYEGQYFAIFDEIADPLPERECKFVFEVLNMYHALQQRASDLAEFPSDLSDAIGFAGFCERDEIELVGYERFLASDAPKSNVFAKLTRTQPPPFAASARYRKMLAAFSQVKRGPDGLTVDQIRTIVDAGNS
jgi:uncharacterized protein YfbU (UPF0304 family)